MPDPKTLAIGALLIVGALASAPVRAVPPYPGTVFVDPDIITSDAPTTWTGLTYTGQGMRMMFDRRINAVAQYNAYLFVVTYYDHAPVEFQVNPEFGDPSSAAVTVGFYAPVIGRLPIALRKDVQTVWIHKGDEVFGGGNNNILIHAGSIAQGYVDAGVLEEALAHEASHTSLDAAHAEAPEWLAAQQADVGFISNYAEDNPTREDVAESFVPWLGLTLASGRMSETDIDKITTAIPNRLAYLDAQGFDLAPLNVIHRDGFEGP